jgi:hypothetical protein
MSSWLGNVVKTCGRKLKSGVKAISKASGKVKKAIDKVPVVGPGLGAVYDISINNQWKLASSVAEGVRVDKAFGRFAKGYWKDAQTLAPYAQSVVSLVPGIGQGASGAIGAGIALANGKPITAAVVAAVRGALPGGPLAGMAFDVAAAAAQGVPPEQIALSALPLGDVQKKAVAKALTVVRKVAEGQRVDEAVFNQALEEIPAEAASAIKVGIAVGKGRSLQKAVADNITPEVLGKVASRGASVLGVDNVLKAGADKIKSEAGVEDGFKVGIGVAASKVKPIDVVAIRTKLKPAAKKGFDIALSTHVARVTREVPKHLTSPAQQFGFFATAGLAGSTPKRKAAMAKTIIADKDARTGAETAINEMLKERSWWNRLVETVKDAVQPD